jgi:transcriptional regulator with XRE-family HTH domain
VGATEQFGANVRRLRRAQKLSQIELSHRCEVHFTEISRLELGKRNPGLLTIVKIAGGLQVPPADLLADIEAPSA